MNIINQIERKLSRFSIQPFYKYIVFAMGGVYLLDLFFPTFGLIFRLSLFRDIVLRGEIWRLLTFLVIPYLGNPLYTFLSLYFYYFIGTTLENRWGARRFLLFYALGALGAIIGAFITGFGSNIYLNLSLFFAFALVFPDYEILLFFVLPIKMKWLALLNALFFLSSFVYQPWSDKVAILFSLANLFLFFGGDIWNKLRQSIHQWKRRRQFQSHFKK